MADKFARPKILVSECLGFKACRYDGSMIANDFIDKLKDYVDMVTVCPEVSIGMSVPREAVRIIKDKAGTRLVTSYQGCDYTEEMSMFAKAYVKEIEVMNLHGAILKSRSPSCGIKDVKIYPEVGKVAASGDKTSGYFGRQVLTLGIPMEDEGRLRNFNIREHFLTRIYTLADFERIKEIGTKKALVDFQSRNKYLLMSYNQSGQKKLGKIVANHDLKPFNQVLSLYEDQLNHCLSRPLRRKTNINMLLHIFGYFKGDLSKDEKVYFLDTLEAYHTEKMPYLVPLNILKSWVVRFNQDYLSMQTIFEPFPKELLVLNDSGKGRV